MRCGGCRRSLCLAARLGAKALFGDEELTPIRGQLTFLVPQPEVTYATSYENTYMFSRRDGVLLGGTHEMGDWNLQPDLTTKAAILAKQASLFDGMRIVEGTLGRAAKLAP
jgi:D-amino-acid oxidase